MNKELKPPRYYDDGNLISSKLPSDYNIASGDKKCAACKNFVPGTKYCKAWDSKVRPNYGCKKWVKKENQ